MNALVLLMAVIISASTLLLDHTPVTATQDINLMMMEEDVIIFILLLFMSNDIIFS